MKAMAPRLKIVLALSSPRRRWLKEQLGIPLTVVDPWEV
jgi:predicted house-cleaning NTP pyrophosphatase (Maf/HAM1 superfamily)